MLFKNLYIGLNFSDKLYLNQSLNIPTQVAYEGAKAGRQPSVDLWLRKLFYYIFPLVDMRFESMYEFDFALKKYRVKIVIFTCKNFIWI